MPGLGTLPAEFVQGALALVIGLLYKLVLDRAKRGEAKMDALAATVNDIDKRLVTLVTLDQLGRMGDRMDGRITTLAQDVAVMKAVVGRDK